ARNGDSKSGHYLPGPVNQIPGAPALPDLSNEPLTFAAKDPIIAGALSPLKRRWEREPDGNPAGVAAGDQLDQCQSRPGCAGGSRDSILRQGVAHGAWH